MNTLEIIEEMRINPALASELRAVLLSEELLSLPERMLAMERTLAELVEISKRHENTLAELVEISKRHENTLAELVEISKRHENTLARHENTLAELVEISKRHENTLAELVEISKRHDGRLGNISGNIYEERCRRYAVPVLSRVSGGLRSIHLLDRAELADRLDDLIDAGKMDFDTREDILLANIVATAKRRSDGEELWIVAEASVTLGASDVRRAKRRAAALGTAMGINCLAAVISDIVPETLDLTGVDLITYHDKAV